MAAAKKPGRGRPKLANPLGSQLNVRIEADVRKAIDGYREKHELREVSDAVRHILRRTLRDEGFLG